MKKIIFFSFLISHFSLIPAGAQTPWSLRQCIDHALLHNISIKQKENQCHQRQLQLSTARWRRLPDLNGSVSENFSFGRGQTLDGTYVNRSTNNTSFSLGTTMPLFTGFQIPNTVKLNQLNLEAATQDLEKAKDDIRMKVAQAYVQILYDMEISDVAHRQIAIDSQQVTRLEMFLKNGKASQAELSQQQATLAQARLTATQADNNRQLALLALTQLLELPSPDDFSIVAPLLSPREGEAPIHADLLSKGGWEVASPEAIYQEALAIKPEVQAEQLRLSAAERNIKIAQAANYPTLNLLLFH